MHAHVEGRGPPAGLLRNLGYLASSIVATRATGLVFGILIRRILATEVIGVWNLVGTLATYLCAVTMGVGYSAERLIPFHRGKRDRARELATCRSLFSWSVVEGAAVAVCALAYALVFAHLHSPDVRLALYVLPLLFVGQKFLSLYMVLFKSAQAFGPYAWTSAVVSLLDALLVVAAFLWGLSGLLWGAAILVLAKVAYYQLVWRRLKVAPLRFELSRRGLREHLPYGPKYSVFLASWAISERADSLLAGYLLGANGLAFYFLGYQLARVTLEVPFALAYIAFPNLMEKLSEGQTAFSREFFRFLRAMVGVLLPIILPLAYFGSELLIRRLLPAFTPAVAPTKICILTAGLLAVRFLYYQVLMAHQRMGALTLIAAIQLPAAFGFFTLLRSFGLEPLVAIASGMFISTAVQISCALWLTRSLVERPRRGWLRIPGAEVATWALCAAVVVLVDVNV